MKIILVILAITASVLSLAFGIREDREYKDLYQSSLKQFRQEQTRLLDLIKSTELTDQKGRDKIRQEISICRTSLKRLDFWLRYFEPVAYRKLNGPLPVEWETEVFEKFEPPYKRKGAGLTLAELYLDEDDIQTDTLAQLIQTSLDSLATFEADSITSQLNTYQHFFLANRMYLLNLAGIYTTGFECPDTTRIIPELKGMMSSVQAIYSNYNTSFPGKTISDDYLAQYRKAMDFVNAQSTDFSRFDHFTFIKDYINPLFRMNQQFIVTNNIYSSNYNDYALNNETQSLFDKSLFISQNSKGIFSLVEDQVVLEEIKKVGKLLFYDPILSGNNKRSCASCHKPTEFFTDTTVSSAENFARDGRLPRNTPSLIDAVFNHLSMLDGKHISLQGQAKDVIQNPNEMNSEEKELIKKVMSCDEYKNAFRRFLKFTPETKTVSLDHIVSAITFYYADFSLYYAPFDDAMNKNTAIPVEARRGFNLFMSKAQCATCHFVPHFNGVKPPYIGSEFEVLGVPADTNYSKLSDDKGRYDVNPATETLHAFRTGSVRNSLLTKPYMHNGVFTTIDQVIDLYDSGGGVGRKLRVENQTLSSDSLRLSAMEKNELKAFLRSMNENIIFEPPPTSLPVSSNKALNSRKTGGEY